MITSNSSISYPQHSHLWWGTFLIRIGISYKNLPNSVLDNMLSSSVQSGPVLSSLVFTCLQVKRIHREQCFSQHLLSLSLCGYHLKIMADLGIFFCEGESNISPIYLRKILQIFTGFLVLGFIPSRCIWKNICWERSIP